MLYVIDIIVNIKRNTALVASNQQASSLVTPPCVRRATRLPEVSLCRPPVQSARILATSASGVQVDLEHCNRHLTTTILLLLLVSLRHELPVHGSVESDG